MGVVIEEEMNFIAKASQKTVTFSIDGRNGDVYKPIGYADIERPIKIQILDLSKIDDILAWLNGEGQFEYENRKTMARFFTELSPNRLSSIRVADANFVRSPFWLKIGDAYGIVTESVTNEGSIFSQPLIRLEKGISASVDLTIAGVRFVYTFSDPYVEIDCEELNATYNGSSRNKQLQIGYEFPKLYPGTNSIYVNSGDCIIKLKRKDRWL